jgi:hypothetical protein
MDGWKKATLLFFAPFIACILATIIGLLIHNVQLISGSGLVLCNLSF